MTFPIDLVLPYVNMNDPEWLKLYRKVKPQSYNRDNRFRDAGSIDLLFDLIDKFCPWLRNIYLVVQSQSQVPNCIDKHKKIKIVLHEDIIPKEYLPTYNSGEIELFIWKCPDLAEHFIYINDDTYPVDVLSPEDFFDENGNPKISIKRSYFEMSKCKMHKQMLKNSEKLVNPDYNEDFIYSDGHSWNAMKRSTWENIFQDHQSEIYDSLSPFRERKNMVQQLCTYWHYFNNQYSQRTIKTKYFRWDSIDKDWVNLYREIKREGYKIICINDNSTNMDYNWMTAYIKFLLISILNA